MTEQWAEHTLTFASLKQKPGWGTPRPQRVDSSRLFGIQFRITDRGAPFDVWIDDLAFIESAPPGPQTLSHARPRQSRLRPHTAAPTTVTANGRPLK